MILSERINAFVKLSSQLKNWITEPTAEFEQVLTTAYHENNWFVRENSLQSISAFTSILSEENLNKWCANYPSITTVPDCRKIGIVMAGNIPMVGFHDLLCVLISGQKAICKLATTDKTLLPFVINSLIEIEPLFKDKIAFTLGKLENIDAVIATGSNNTSRYFEYYFGKYPNIIRKNRNSIAVLDGNESKENIKLLGNDIFNYFGLGCRNVAKLFVPKEYDFSFFYENIFDFGTIINHHKYNNNYTYNRTIYLMNEIKMLDNNFLILKEDEANSSPIGVLYFQYYSSTEDLNQLLISKQEDWQCVVTNSKLNIGCSTIAFGNSQSPDLNDYADGMDTLKFVLSV